MIEEKNEIDIFQKVIQRLTFTPEIVMSDLAKSGIELEIGREKFDKILLNPNDIYEYDLKYEIAKSRERYINILSRLAIDTNVEKNLTELFPCHKVYSDKLKERQLCLYNDMAKKVGFSQIRHIIPIELMKEICVLDGVDLNKGINDVVYKYYLYFFGGKINGVTFIEYILLLNIYRCVGYRTLFMLNKNSKSSKDIKICQDLKEYINSNISSPEFYRVYIDTFFEVFYYIFKTEYNENSKEYIRTLWLPDEYRERKNVFDVVKKHGEYQGYKINAENWYEYDKTNRLIDTSQMLEYLLYQLLPSVWKTMLLKCDRKITGSRTMEFGYEDIDDSEKKQIVKYSRIIDTYISHSIRDCKIILNTFL